MLSKFEMVTGFVREHQDDLTVTTVAAIARDLELKFDEIVRAI